MNTRVFAILLCSIVWGATLLSIAGCSTAPKAEDQGALVADAEAAVQWFERSVPGLRGQLDRSAGYIIFPGVGQWGILIGGGKFGRGMVCAANGDQVGWSSINTGSIGLQAGVQGFKMLVVFQDWATFNEFKQGDLAGSASGVAVVGGSGLSGTAPFRDGVAVYQGANSGLMAGVNIGLDYMRFEPLGR